jgi:hypothetical protein
MLNEIKNKKLVRDRVVSLKTAINCSKVFTPYNTSQFVFLCGANKSKDQISERRRALIDFSRKNLPHTQFFLAENIFSTLQDEGHKDNILDVENLISDFSDFIIIILESPSAFAELGAFSHETLREKLVVINDFKFKDEKSFINLGPIKAIEEKAGKDRIIHYKMSSDGIHKKDAIGDIYNDIYQLFKDPVKVKRKPLTIDMCDPSKCFDKTTAMFIHDLIYLSGPILHKELIELLILVFGDKAFNDVKHLLAILTSFDSIERNKASLFRSRRKDTYFNYLFDLTKIISMFRNYTLKLYPERIYEY